MWGTSHQKTIEIARATERTNRILGPATLLESNENPRKIVHFGTIKHAELALEMITSERLPEKIFKV
jgi:hypothetical protein